MMMRKVRKYIQKKNNLKENCVGGWFIIGPMAYGMQINVS